MSIASRVTTFKIEQGLGKNREEKLGTLQLQAQLSTPLSTTQSVS